MNLNRTRAVFIRHVYNFRHHLDRLTDSFYWPVIDILIWGLTSQYVQQGNQLNNLIMILLSGLIFWQVVWRGQYEIAVNFLEELWSTNFVNLFSTPLRVGEWLLALLGLGFAKMFVTVGLSMVVVWFLYAVNILTFGWLLIPFFASLLMVGWWVGLFVTGLLVLFGRQIQTFAWAGVYLLAPFSAIYYPVSSLPVWAQTVARFLPTAYIFEGMREVLLTGAIPFEKLVISFGLNIVYLIISILYFRWCFRRSLVNGLARLEY
jgi:ABC-2 type transport system permease protein